MNYLRKFSLILNNNINKRMVCFKHKLIMKLNILQIICLINYVVTFPNDLFDELWQTNQSELQANSVESQPKIKIEPHEEKFDGRWRDESALKGIVKVEHLGAVKVEGTVKIKHEFKSWDEESGELQLGDHVKEEVQDGQAPNTSDQKKIGDDDENWSEDENNSTKIKSYQQKQEILKQFDEIKSKCKKAKLKNILMCELDEEIAKKLGVCRGTIYEWKRKFGLSIGKKKFSDFEKREILKQFDEIKSKCKNAKLKNILMSELETKLAKKFGVCRHTIYEWKRKFGLSVGKKKFSDVTKIGILKKYAKIKRKDPKMSNAVIVDMLKISTDSLRKWKKQFKDEMKNL